MKREILLPAIAAGVLVAFTAVSLLVWATRGRSGPLVRRKLALGALLIGLTAVATGCDDEGIVTCYDPVPPPNQITLADDSGTGLVMDLAADSTVEGTIHWRQGTTFSFRIVRIAGDAESLLQSGDIAAADGAYDADTETFTIQVEPTLIPGDYLLRFYGVPAASVTGGTQRLFTVTLQITLSEG